MVQDTADGKNNVNSVHFSARARFTGTGTKCGQGLSNMLSNKLESEMISLAACVGKIKQILCHDWLPAQLTWSYLAIRISHYPHTIIHSQSI